MTNQVEYMFFDNKGNQLNLDQYASNENALYLNVSYPIVNKDKANFTLSNKMKTRSTRIFIVFSNRELYKEEFRNNFK